MKEIKIPIISCLSIAATLALMPIQVLAVNDTVATDESGNNVYVKGFSSGDPATAQNYSGGFIGNVNGGSTSPSNHIVTIKGVNPGTPNSKDSTKFIVYGGGIGDGSRVTYPGGAFKFQQNQVAKNNELVLQNKAYIWIGVGGEGKGAEGNSVSVTNSTVRGAVLGGNGTWYNQERDSGDAIHNVVNISGNSQVLFQGYNGFNNTSVAGGRATGNHSADGNEVNISGTPTIEGRIAGALVDKGGADGNKVDITGVINSLNVNGVIASKDSTATLQNNIVTINNDGAVVTDVLVANGTGGGIEGPGGKATAINNHGKLIKGTVGNINGAYMVSKTEKNHSTIEGGHVTNYAYGSYYRNDAHDLKSNSKGDYVTISGGKVDKAIYGAFTYYGDIDGAHVDMSNGKVVGTNIAGDDGVFGGLSYDGTVNNSYLDLTGGEISGDAIGGRSNNKDVANNYAKINGGAKIGGRLIGGESRGKTATNSYLDLTGGEIGGDSIGSLGSTGAVQSRITASGTKFNGNVIGGKSSSGNVTGSRVTLTNVTASKNVIGGEAQSGNTDDNQVSLINGSVSGDVYGSKASGSATNSVVNLSGAQVAGNVYAADAASGSNNTVNFYSGSVTKTIYGLSSAGSTNNTLNVYNAHTQKTAGDIKNFNALNFDGISSANGSAATAALNLNASSTTDINNAKFKLDNADYNVDTYAIGDGEKRYLIHNENGFTGFDETQTTKRTDNVFTIKNATTYSMNLKGLMKDDDGKSIVIQGKKKTDRTITGAFDSGEITKYSGPAGNPTIDVGENPNAPENFGGLDIDTNNVPNATINLVSGDDIGEIRANDDDTINVGKDSNNPLVPGKITAKNISGAGKLNFNVPDGFSGSDTALTLTDGNPTDLSGTKISVNSDKLADNTQYTLINKTNGTINQLDRTIQKDQVYTIKNANEYSFVGESYKTDASLKKLQYSKGTQTRNWDGEFDYGETELNKITNAANNGHSLDRNKNNTVIIDANAGNLNGKKIYGGSTAASDTLDIHDNTVEINGGTNIGDVIAGNNASSSGKVSNNVINFNAGALSGKLYGSDDASNARGNNSGNTLNVNNAHTQKTAGDIKNFNALNFDGVTAATNGAIDRAALNLTTNADTDINNAKFKLNGEEYDVDKDTYGSLNIEEGKEYHLIRNAGNTFTSFTEKAKQTTSEFTLKNSTTYDIMLKGLIKSSDDQSILIQGSKLTSRNITGGEFGNDEINRYNPIPNPVINVVNEDPNSPTNFNGLNINGGNNSTVNLTGGNNIGNITGGAGSTLNVGKNTTNPAAPNSITAKNIGGFDDINIFMPPTVKDGDSMIKLTDPTANTDLSNMRGKITAYVSGNTDVGDTSTIHLIDKQGSGRLLLPNADHLQTKVQQGATIDYETYAMVDANGKALDLKFSGKKKVKDDAKSFAETRAASLASLKSGSELITNYLDKLIPDGHLELFPFAISEAYSLRHETGSHVNSKGYGVAAGLASLTENFAGDILSGVFVEYGRANYDSYLDNGLHADGDSEYIGGGLMLKQNFTSGTYLDASFHVGKISSDYNSNDWTYAVAPGVLAHNEKFDISSTYMATHIGIGQIFDLSESNKLDVYTKWLYAYTDDADATISSGERYHFDSVTSNRVRAGLRDTINLKDEHNLYFGGAYEYEFSGDAKASTMGLDAPKPSLKGSTGVFEAGYKYESKNLILSLGGKGYIGKTRGGAINAGFEVMF